MVEAVTPSDLITILQKLKHNHIQHIKLVITSAGLKIDDQKKVLDLWNNIFSLRKTVVQILKEENIELPPSDEKTTYSIIPKIDNELWSHYLHKDITVTFQNLEKLIVIQQTINEHFQSLISLYQNGKSE